MYLSAVPWFLTKDHEEFAIVQDSLKRTANEGGQMFRCHVCDLRLNGDPFITVLKDATGDAIEMCRICGTKVERHIAHLVSEAVNQKFEDERNAREREGGQ